MKLDKSKLALADKVLKALGRIGGGEGWVSAYANGREQGYHIWYSVPFSSHRPAASFSENRNSDDVVVYLGQSADFDMAGHVPNEAVYRAARYFQSPTKAAEAIHKHFTTLAAARQEA